MGTAASSEARLSLIGEAYDAWFHGLQTPESTGFFKSFALLLPVILLAFGYQYVSAYLGMPLEVAAYFAASAAQIWLLLPTAAAIQRFVASRSSLEDDTPAPAAGSMTRDYLADMARVAAPAFFAVSGAVNFVLGVIVLQAASSDLVAAAQLSSVRVVWLNAAICLGGVCGLYVWRDAMARVAVSCFFGSAMGPAPSGRRLEFRLGAILLAIFPIVVFGVVASLLIFVVSFAMPWSDSGWGGLLRGYYLFALLDASIVWTVVRVVAGGTARLHVVIDGPVQAPPAATAPA